MTLSLFAIPSWKPPKIQVLTKLFDYVDVKGGTFVERADHTARFQSYLIEGDFNGEVRTLPLSNGIVNLVYWGLLKLQKMFTSEVCPNEGVRSRIAPAMGRTNTHWEEPIVLYSKGGKEIDNMSMPQSAFTNQALHCGSIRKSPTPTPGIGVTEP